MSQPAEICLKRLIGQLWERNRMGLIAFVLAASVSLFFILRLGIFWIYWSDPAHRGQPIEGWMTPGYIAYSHHVPRGLIAEALGLTPGRHPHKTLEDIAEESGRTVEELKILLNAIIAEQQRAGE